ncbi:MAG: hypothetical protein JXA25_07235 [Anaerolineales bacterium]|nr:hypothetical protein [Anaerolineales bacterium]
MYKAPRAILAAFLLIGCLTGCTANSSLLSSLEQITSFNFLQKDSGTTVRQSSIIAKDGSARFTIYNQTLTVVIDPSGAPETDGVVISTYSLGESYLVETADPLERFLPSVQILSAGPGQEEVLQVPVPQPLANRWNMTQLDPVNIRLLKSVRLGTSTAAGLPLFLQKHTSSIGLNLLLPGEGIGPAEQEVFVYQTPASKTLLVLPVGNATGGMLDAAEIPLLALSVLAADLPRLSETLLLLEPPFGPNTDSLPEDTAPNSTAGAPAPDAIPTMTATESSIENGTSEDSLAWLDELPATWAGETAPIWQAEIPEQWLQPAAEQENTTSQPYTNPGLVSAAETLTLTRGQSSTLTCPDGLLLVTRQGSSTAAFHCSSSIAPDPVVYTAPLVHQGLLGSCPEEVHDRFTVTGPDGNTYRTWHPVTVAVNPSLPNSPLCTFAHEHGDPPHPDAPPPVFGYAAYHAGQTRQIADHAGYKVFTHQIGNRTGWDTPETGQASPDWDMMIWAHMGTSSPDRITTRFHEVGFWSRDMENRITEIILMADTGTAVDGCDADIVSPARRIASSCRFTEETWDYMLQLNNWNASFEVTVHNPVTYISGDIDSRQSVQLLAVSETICGTAKDPCSERLQFGSGGSFWLGNLRTLGHPDWRWHNYGGEEFTCSDPYGVPLAQGQCSQSDYGAIRQRVAALSWIGEPGFVWDRTFNGSPWDADNTLSLGAPMGN